MWESKQLVPMLAEVLRFPDYEHNERSDSSNSEGLVFDEDRSGPLGLRRCEFRQDPEIELPSASEDFPGFLA